MEPTKLYVTVETEPKEFAVGDFLNALDELCCYFLNSREISDNEMINALAIYRNRIKETV